MSTEIKPPKRGSKLVLEINSKGSAEHQPLAGIGILITPKLGGDNWLFRVRLSEKQSIIGFSKFGCIGVGFAEEEDWNTNLPTSAGAIEIYDHIKRNKGDRRISRGKCIEAIQLIKDYVIEMRRKIAVDEIKKIEALRNACSCGIDPRILETLGRFLRMTGSHEVAEAFHQ